MKTILIRVVGMALAAQLVAGAAQQTGDADRQLRAAMNTATVDGNLPGAMLGGLVLGLSAAA